MRVHRVRALPMGGRACVCCRAAEFSRDTDFAILADSKISRGYDKPWPLLLRFGLPSPAI